MSDTVSATQFWTLGDVRMNFLAPEGGSPQPEVGSSHIAGGANSTYSSPSSDREFRHLGGRFPVAWPRCRRPYPTDGFSLCGRGQTTFNRLSSLVPCTQPDRRLPAATLATASLPGNAILLLRASGPPVGTSAPGPLRPPSGRRNPRRGAPASTPRISMPQLLARPSARS